MTSRVPVNMIYAKTDSTVKNREYAFTKTFESVFDEDTFFNSCLQYTLLSPLLSNPTHPEMDTAVHPPHLTPEGDGRVNLDVVFNGNSARR